MITNKVVKELKTAFTPAQLEEAWYNFKERLKEKPTLSYLFETKTPTLKDDFLVSIDVTSKNLEKELNTYTPELLSYLKKALKNDFIKFEMIIVEQRREVSVTSPKEKAQLLAEKNPELRELFKKLQLGFA